MTTHVWFDLVSATLFFALWVGYAFYSKQCATLKPSLYGVMKLYTNQWMRNSLASQSNLDDISVLASLDRQRSFYGSTTLFILAGLITSLTQVEAIQVMISSLIYAQPLTALQVQLRLFLLIAIFIYAYFTLTWSMRQLGFASVMLGAGQFQAGPCNASRHNKETVHKQEAVYKEEAMNDYANSLAHVLGMSAYSFNNGLRAYYFAMSAVTWFYHSYALLISCVFVVTILYRREFHSTTLAALTQAQKVMSQAR